MIRCDIDNCQNEAKSTISEHRGYTQIIRSMNVCEMHADSVFNRVNR